MKQESSRQCLTGFGNQIWYFFTTWTVWTPPVTTWFNQLYIYPPKILVFGVEQPAWGPRIVTGFSRCQGPTCTTFQDVLELYWYPFIAQQFHKLMKGVFSTTSLFRASIGPFFQAFRKTTNPTRKKKPFPPRWRWRNASRCIAPSATVHWIPIPMAVWPCPVWPATKVHRRSPMVSNKMPGDCHEWCHYETYLC